MILICKKDLRYEDVGIKEVIEKISETIGAPKRSLDEAEIKNATDDVCVARLENLYDSHVNWLELWLEKDEL